MNGFMGAPEARGGASVYRRLGDIIRPGPAEALVFIEERVDTINDGSFSQQWDFDPNQPGGWVLRDKPGIVHKRGCNLAFADGHAVVQRWQDPRTVSAPRDDALMPGNADVLWLQRHSKAR